MPWDPRSWASEFDVSDLRAVIGATVTSPGQELSFFARPEGPEAAYRALGCYLILSMPSAALGQALEDLGSTYAFATERALPPAPITVTHSKGRIVQTSVRPNLQLPE